MAEIVRDIFPTHVLRRMTTPISRKNAVSNMAVSRNRPYGGILQPVPQQPNETRNNLK